VKGYGMGDETKQNTSPTFLISNTYVKYEDAKRRKDKEEAHALAAAEAERKRDARLEKHNRELDALKAQHEQLMGTSEGRAAVSSPVTLDFRLLH